MTCFSSLPRGVSQESDSRIGVLSSNGDRLATPDVLAARFLGDSISISNRILLTLTLSGVPQSPCSITISGAGPRLLGEVGGPRFDFSLGPRSNVAEERRCSSSISALDRGTTRISLPTHPDNNKVTHYSPRSSEDPGARSDCP